MKYSTALVTSSLLMTLASACADSGGTPGATGQDASGGLAGALGGATSATNSSGGSPASTGIGIGLGAAAGQSTTSGTEATCGIQSYARETKPAMVILVLDRSQSMEDKPSGGTISKWAMTIPPLRSVVTATNSGIDWGLKLYPELDSTASCAPESIVPLIHVPVAANNAATVVAKIDAATPLGDGTPTGDAIKFATAHLDELALTADNPKFILLATDGDPSCPSSDAIGYATSAISAALTKGYPTFVIGVDTTSSSSIKRLNAMAQAGGKPRVVTDPTTEPQFYLASTQTALESALGAITTSVASCVFDLVPPPPVPENIAVDFNGVRADRDPTKVNGWDYTKADFTQLEVYGEFCQRIKTEAKNQVQIRYGCPNQEIPLIIQ